MVNNNKKMMAGDLTPAFFYFLRNNFGKVVKKDLKNVRIYVII